MKNYILLGVIALLLLGGIATYSLIQMNQQSITISHNGVSFSYPKTLTVQEIPSTEGNYKNYQIMNPAIESEHSYISVSVPLKDSSMPYTLADNIKGKADPSKITTFTLNGYQGEMITYRLDTNYPGDIPTHATVTRQELKSKYQTTPVSLEYFKNDADPISLDPAWEMIQKTLKY